MGYSTRFEDVTRQKTEDCLTKEFCGFVMIEDIEPLLRLSFQVGIRAVAIVRPLQGLQDGNPHPQRC